VRDDGEKDDGEKTRRDGKSTKQICKIFDMEGAARSSIELSKNLCVSV
jgi:hypothetical protein